MLLNFKNTFVFLCALIGITSSAYGQCSFDIEADDTTICEKEIIKFSIKNLPSNVKEVLWDVGGFKQVKNDNKPAVIFTNYGKYDVSLTITLNDNSSCTVKKTNYINVYPVPRLGKVWASKNEVCGAGDRVQFSSSSTDAVKWNWAVEGSAYNGANSTITHKFENTGWPYVQLTVVNKEGCTNSYIYDSLVHVLNRPKVDLSKTNFLVCEVPGTLRVQPKFDYRGTDIKSYAWTFKGATTETDLSENPSPKFYKSPGKYDIELSLRSKSGCSFDYVFKDTVDVINISSVDVRAESMGGKNCPSMRFKFLVEGIDTSLFHWDFNQADIESIDSSIIDSTVIVFKNEGKNIVNLVVNRPPCLVTNRIVVDAKKGGVRADFTAPDCLCNVPDSLVAINTSYGSGTLTYNWQVIGKRGFEIKRTDKHLREELPSVGKYKLVLKSSLPSGCYDLESKRVEVKRNIITADMLRSVSCITGDFDVVLDSFCNIEPDGVTWYFIDRNDQVAVKEVGSSIKAVFPDTGLYHLAIVLKSKTGCLDSFYFEKQVLVIDCFAGLGEAFVPDSGCTGDIQIGFITANARNLDVKAELILQTDTTVTYKGSFKDPIIRFYPKKPGIYNLRAEISLKDGSGKRTYYIKSIAKVNQLKIEGEIGATWGCFPNKKTELKVKSIDNQMFWGQDDKSVLIEWKIYPSDKGALDNGYAKDPILTSFEAGQIDIELKAENSTKCKASWQSVNRISENLKPEFFIPKDACFSDTIIINNQSTGPIVQYEWHSDNPGDYFYPNQYVRTPEFRPFDEGRRELTLLITDTNTCVSTIKKKITLVDIALDFTVNDTAAKCSPATYRFAVSGKNIDNYFWDFGDGDALKTSSKNVVKIYDLRRVNPYRNKFTVKLSGKHSSGCEQTVIKKELIKVKGPWPNFTIDNNLGCTPLAVNITDNSKKVHKLYFDFGDNTSVDSVINGPHIYTVDTTKEFEKYRPYVVAHDKFDCKVGFYLNDTIKVYSLPIARFGASPKSGCEPLDVGLKSRSKYAEKHRWNIPQANYAANFDKTSTTLMAGVYDAQLVVQNKIGCQDVLYKPKVFTVFENPTASFVAADSVACLNRDLQFASTSFAKAGIKNYRWNSRVGVDKDSAFTEDFKPFFTDNGNLWARLIIEDNNGCIDSFELEKVAKIYDSLPVQTPYFSFLSHLSNNEIALNWNKQDGAYLRNLKLWNLNYSIPKLANEFGADAEGYTLKNDSFSNNSNCFQLELIDKCRDVYPSKKHCTVHLDVDKANKKTTALSWNHYYGWDSIATYTVLRAEENGNYLKLATVPGGQTTYIDSNFCDSTYRYLIVANQFGQPFSSHSNSLKHKNEYTYQDVPLEIMVSTVDDNNGVLTTWLPSKQLGNIQYQISKREQLGAKNLIWKSTADTFIKDVKAGIDDFHYTYKVRVKDQCGNISKASNIGRSVLLKVTQTDNNVALLWNQYHEWQNGVKEYVVEVKPPNEKWFSELGAVSDTTINHPEAYLAYEEPYYYRVKAVENATMPDTSYSNERMVIPVPSIYAANAFTPNGDGLNDTFSIMGWALLEDVNDLEEFSLKIYNRWGERVFESHDISLGWDGTFNGVKCQLDQYIWHATATALNGKTYFLRGGVLLMR